MMRNRLWSELCKAKHNGLYCVKLLAYRKRLVNMFTTVILVCSSAGIMGWKIWNDFPLFSCIIISTIQILRLIQPQYLPTERQIDKLDSVVDFYFDYFNKLEQLWLDFENDRKTELEVQTEFYVLKDSEKPINKIINDIVKRTNKKILAKCDIEANEYLTAIYN